MRLLSAFIILLASTNLLAAAFFQAPSNWARPGATLDLDFRNDRYVLNGTNYIGIANFITASGATFTRASNATYIDSTGTIATASSNTPRMEYDSETLARRGILIEEGSTNILTYSSDFTNSWAVAPALTISPSAQVAPDGTITGNLITANGSGLSYFAKSGLSVTPNAWTSSSIYLKPVSLNDVYFEIGDNGGTGGIAHFDLVTMNSEWFGGPSVNRGQLKITKLKNGWLRIQASYKYGASSTGYMGYNVYIGAYGNGVGSAHFWGAQLELKPFASNYIPTTSAAASRADDNFSIPTASWYNSTTGTFLATSHGQLNGMQLGYSRIIGLTGGKSILGFSDVDTNIFETFTGQVLHISHPVMSLPTTTVTTPVSLGISWNQGTTTRSMATGGVTVSQTGYAGDYTGTEIYPGGSDYDFLNAALCRISFYPQFYPTNFLKGMSN